ELLRGLFSGPGSFLVGITSILLLLIGRASFSFVELCHRIVRAFQALQRSLLRALGRVRAAWQEAGELRRAAAARAVSEPVIEVGGDEAIVHRLEEEAPWIPMEATGVPPLSL